MTFTLLINEEIKEITNMYNIQESEMQFHKNYNHLSVISAILPFVSFSIDHTAYKQLDFYAVDSIV